MLPVGFEKRSSVHGSHRLQLLDVVSEKLLNALVNRARGQTIRESAIDLRITFEEPGCVLVLEDEVDIVTKERLTSVEHQIRAKLSSRLAGEEVNDFPSDLTGGIGAYLEDSMAHMTRKQVRETVPPTGDEHHLRFLGLCTDEVATGHFPAVRANGKAFFFEIAANVLMTIFAGRPGRLVMV